MGIDTEEAEIADIQDLISDYRQHHPFCRASELKGHLIDLLERDYGVGIEVSYPMIDAALSNELFRYQVKKQH